VEIPEPASLYNQPYFGSEATRGRNDSLLHRIGTSISLRNTEHNTHSSYARMWFGAGIDNKVGTHLAYQKYLKHYLRCVKGIDDNLGRLFEYLKKEGLWENTVIVYTADQGMMLGEHDYLDKRWMYEESMRMPFIVFYPAKIKPAQRTELLINNTDFAPTLLELAGGEPPTYMQGRSFVNTLKGIEENNWRTATYYRYWMHIIHHWVPAHFGLRTADYKLVFYYGKHYLPQKEHAPFYWALQYDGVGRETPAAWEFYDLRNDPEELHNRYNDPHYKEMIDQLKAELIRQRKELNETDADYPELQKIIDRHWND